MISIEEAKAHLNVSHSEDDALIAAQIAAAQSFIGNYTGSQTLPADAGLKEACKRIVAEFYENRELVVVGFDTDNFPLGIAELLAPYRNWSF